MFSVCQSLSGAHISSPEAELALVSSMIDQWQLTIQTHQRALERAHRAIQAIAERFLAGMFQFSSH